eukprot:gene27155-2389_t
MAHTSIQASKVRGLSTCHARPTRSLHAIVPVAAPRQALSRFVCFATETMTDATVPEGHKGLHGALYGEGGAEEHSSAAYNFRKGEDDGENMIPVEKYLEDRDGEKPLGVYVLYDENLNVQFVSYNRNVVLAVRGHMNLVGPEQCAFVHVMVFVIKTMAMLTKGHMNLVGPEQCAFVRVMVFANKAMATRTNMQKEVDRWIDEFGTIPPGNGADKARWEGRTDPSLMSADELAEYEEKKLKMQKAMGENINDDIEGEEVSSKQRRLNLIKAVKCDHWSFVIDGQTQNTAVEGDDWSSVIDGQTQDTVDPDAVAPAVVDKVKAPVVSPFTRARVHR